jgi:hypothetical protein
MSHHSPNPDLSDRYGADSNRRITRKAKITLPPGEGGGMGHFETFWDN